MTTFRTGNMWTVWDEVDFFVITTNSTIKQNGAVVMGRGIAKQVRGYFPGIGNGGLPYGAVRPLLDDLPSNKEQNA